MHNTNSSTHMNAHYTLVFIRKHHSDTKAQTHLHMHKHTHTTHTITQVKTAVLAQHAALESTSLFAQVLRVAHVP